MDHRRDTEIMSAFIHGALAALHTVGFLHNYRRKNVPETIIHAGALVFDVYSTYIHLKDVRNPE